MMGFSTDEASSSKDPDPTVLSSSANKSLPLA
jgi:hypothetical protein